MKVGCIRPIYAMQVEGRCTVWVAADSTIPFDLVTMEFFITKGRDALTSSMIP